MSEQPSATLTKSQAPIQPQTLMEDFTAPFTSILQGQPNSPDSEAESTTPNQNRGGQDKINLKKIKEDFKNTTLGILSKTVGARDYESGANRNNENAHFDNQDTNINKDNGFFGKLLLHGRNILNSGKRDKLEREKINLEMMSASIYKLFAGYIDQFTNFFDASGNFDDSKKDDYFNFKKALRMEIKTMFRELTTNSTLDRNELNSCESLILSCFDIYGNFENGSKQGTLQQISGRIKTKFDNLEDTQNLAVQQGALERAKLVAAKFLSGIAGKSLAVAGAPFSFGVGSIAGAAAGEAWVRQQVTIRSADKVIDNKARNLNYGLNEELEHLYKVDGNNVGNPIPSHEDQTNQFYSPESTSPDFVLPLNKLYKNAIREYKADLTNPEKRQNVIRYAYIWFNHIQEIRDRMTNGNAHLSAATFATYNRAIKDSNKMVVELHKSSVVNLSSELVKAENGTLDDFVQCTSELSMQLDDSDNNDRIALEVNTAKKIGEREENNIKEFSKRKKEEIRKEAKKKFLGEFGWCTAGNFFAVLFAGIGAMDNNIQGEHAVSVTDGIEKNAFGGAHKEAGQWLDLNGKIREVAGGSFGDIANSC